MGLNIPPMAASAAGAFSGIGSAASIFSLLKDFFSSDAFNGAILNSLRPMAKATMDWAADFRESARMLLHLHEKTDISTDTLQELQHAAKAESVDFEAVVKDMTALREKEGSSEKADIKFMELANKMKDKSWQEAKKIGEEYNLSDETIRLLRKGDEHIADLREQAKRTGNVLDKTALEGVENRNKNFKLQEANQEGMRKRAYLGVEPTLSNMAEDGNVWLDTGENREWMEKSVDEAAKGAVKVLEELRGALKGITTKDLDEFFKEFGGLEKLISGTLRKGIWDLWDSIKKFMESQSEIQIDREFGDIHENAPPRPEKPFNPSLHDLEELQKRVDTTLAPPAPADPNPAPDHPWIGFGRNWAPEAAPEPSSVVVTPPATTEKKPGSKGNVTPYTGSIPNPLGEGYTSPRQSTPDSVPTGATAFANGIAGLFGDVSIIKEHVLHLSDMLGGAEFAEDVEYAYASTQTVPLSMSAYLNAQSTQHYNYYLNQNIHGGSNPLEVANREARSFTQQHPAYHGSWPETC